ncbi:MAG: type II secretion system GspH family protein [Oscillospiraceae bacterium]|nr:type II secretion system GspH family protein [Oscillospiraceae bacterium]
MKSKAKGFTLIELIVVIGIIGVLAAILVPSMLGYLRSARIAKYNANAKLIHTSASMFVVDLYRDGKPVGQDTVFLSSTAGVPIAVANGVTIDLTENIGKAYGGYFGFLTDSLGLSVVCAVWSDFAVTADMVEIKTADEVAASFAQGKPVGVHPLRVGS